MAYSEFGPHKIWYEHEGKGDPVLLIMGYGMRGAAWYRQVETLSKHHHVAFFDHAGLGESAEVFTHRLKMEHLAADALGVANTLGWDRFHVVGISMGGMIAQHVALGNKDRIRSLTLTATHAGNFRSARPPLAGLKQFIRANRASTPAGQVEALSKLLFSEDFILEQPELAGQLIEADFGIAPSVRTRLAQLHAITRHNTRKRLHELAVIPTLVVRPDLDILIHPSNSDHLHKNIPNASIANFASGHGITRQCAEEFNALVLEHFAQASK